MKRFVSMICATWIILSVTAQTQTLCISTIKTTSIVFPYDILHVDRGTKDILVQLVNDAKDLLLIKAGETNFAPTNLTVYTMDGKVYSFDVCYDESPELLIHHVNSVEKNSLESYAGNLLDNKQAIFGIKTIKANVASEVTGIYIQDDMIFLQMRLTNKSPISYEVDLIRLYIRDKKRDKKTALQEFNLEPVYVTGNIKKVKAYDQSTIVMALNKFTLSDKKFLAIQFMEKRGSRHLLLKVNNRKMMQAIMLPKFQ